MSTELFKHLHTVYKNLQRIKPLINLKENTTRDTFDVFRSRLEELYNTVTVAYENQATDSSDKRRLAAMLLVLRYENALISIQNVPPADEKSTNLPNELFQLKEILKQYEVYRMNEEIFFVYFKALNFLVHVYCKQIENCSAAQDCFAKAETMYELLTNDDQSGNRLNNFYNFTQLFSKSNRMRPVADGLDQVEALFNDNLEIMETIYRKQGDTFNVTKTVVSLLRRQQNMKNVLPLVWLEKLVSLVPDLLNEHQFKMASYYLLVALKVLTQCSINNAEIHHNKLRGQIITHWMYYTFWIFNLSMDVILHKYAKDELYVFRNCFALVNIGSGDGIGEIHRRHYVGDKIDTIYDENFNCFATSTPLTDQELKLCMNSIKQIEEANNLLHHSIDMLQKAIDDCDIIVNPMDFITFHYQLSDLLSIMSMLVDNANQCYFYQRKRMEHFDCMIQLLKDCCPRIFSIVCAHILTDFNEVLIDLHQTNFIRIFAEASISGENRKELKKIIQKKVIDLRGWNQYVRSIGAIEQ